MNTKPFSVTPDVLHVSLSTQFEGLVIKNFESEWGATDERLCYFNGTLIGRLEPGNSDGTNIINLIPRLESKRKYAWPSKVEFTDAIIRLLGAAQGWIVRCEHDADQHTVEVINGLNESIAALNAALSYCSGESVCCPNFSAHRRK